METRQEIFDKVRQCLVTVLGVDSGDVREDASLVDDLEAESIDFVDLIFRLEKSFGIHIPQGELFPQDFFSNKAYVKDGQFTPEGLGLLRQKYPFIEIEQNDGEAVPAKLSRLYTVRMLVNYIDFKKKTA